MHLYLIAYTGDDDDDFDLLVWAATRRQAVELWLRHFHLEGDAETPDPVPGRVFVVPTAPPAAPKALDWHNDVLEAPEDHPLVSAVLEARAAHTQEA